MSQDERTMGMLCHLLAFTGLIGPLIIWLVKKDQYPFVDDQGKESLNFQISFLIYSAIAAVFSLFTCGIGSILFVPIALLQIILVILATIDAYNGRRYRYPLTIRFLT